MKLVKESLGQTFNRNADKLSSIGVGKMFTPIVINNLTSSIISNVLGVPIFNFEIKDDWCVIFDLNIDLIHTDFNPPDFYRFTLTDEGELNSSVPKFKYSSSDYEFKIRNLKELKDAIYDKFNWD
jgi:hypothetical protein